MSSVYEAYFHKFPTLESIAIEKKCKNENLIPAKCVEFVHSRKIIPAKFLPLTYGKVKRIK